MTFKLQTSEIDLGQTAIENLFITDFMPMATNGTYIKVYLLGYHYAILEGTHHISNESIAKQLAVSIEDVVNAWLFWEEKGIVKCIENEALHSKHQFDVIFLSIRELYITNNFQPQQVAQLTKSEPKQSDRMLSAMSNPVLKQMFANVQYHVRRPLTYQETVRILDWITHYKMDPDMIERAFQITYEERQIKEFHFNYIEGIIIKWYDQRILSVASLEAYIETKDSRYSAYKKLYQAIGIGNRLVSAGDKEIIDKWLDEEALSLDVLLYAVKEASKRTNNPHFNYLDKIIQNIPKDQGVSLSDVATYFEKQKLPSPESDKTSSGPKKKSKFQNFSQSTIADMSDDDMAAILKRKASQRLAKRGK